MLHPPLTDIDYLQSLAARHGISPKRSAGQNFLISAEVVEASLELAATGPKHITELGAGLGTLTAGLAGANFKIRAIEKDPALAKLLQHELSPREREHVEIVIQDLKETDWTWDTPYQIIGNIPYNISGLILRRLCELKPAPTQVVLLVQQEVGERLVAQPPNMHLLSVAVQLWADTQMVMHVPAACFWPAPEVSSALVLFTPHQVAPLSAADTHTLKLAKYLFRERRKQMIKRLTQVTASTPEEIGNLLQKLDLPTTARPQELDLDQWRTLSRELSIDLSKLQ